MDKKRSFGQEGVLIEVKYVNTEHLINDYEELICELISLYMGILGCDTEEIIDTINEHADYFIANIHASKEESEY